MSLLSVTNDGLLQTQTCRSSRVGMITVLLSYSNKVCLLSWNDNRFDVLLKLILLVQLER